ncbi:MAG: hypothetical protein AAGG06_07295, partial [Pseudomonadota bacterium]
MFVMGALLGGRDVWEVYATLPATVVEHGAALEHLTERVDALETPTDTAAPDGSGPSAPRTPAAILTDAQAGEWSLLHLGPLPEIKATCRPTKFDLKLIDRVGQWFEAETTLGGALPSLDTAVALGVRVHPRMTLGRATAVASVSYDCGSHRTVQSVSIPAFTVLGH